MEYKLFKNEDEIRESLGRESGKKDMYALWQLCFGDSDPYTDFYFEWKVKDNKVYTIYKGDQICAMLHLNPYLLRVKNRPVNAYYIVGVATKPEERRRGLMKQLLETALKEMYKGQMEFTYLMPAAEAIYLPYDFRTVYEQIEWNKIISDYNNSNTSSTTIQNITMDQNITSVQVSQLKLTDTAAIEMLASFCNKLLDETYDVYVERTSYYFQRLLFEMISCEGGILLCYDNLRLIGFASYMAEEKVYITEMIYQPSMENHVLHGISEYMHNIVGKEIYLRKEDSQKPEIMARIVNWNAFIKNISATEPIELIVQVRDPIIADNQGVYLLSFTNEGCQSKRTDKTPEIHGDIAELTQLFFGKMKEAELTKLVISTEKKCMLNKLAKINKYQKVFINDVV
jgi:predicted acetyltransferase